MIELVSTVLPYISPAAIPLVVCVCFYFFIQTKRKETKVERDKDSQNIHDKLLRHDFEIGNIKGDLAQQHNVNEDLSKQIIELSKAVASFSAAVDTLKDIVKDLKEDFKDLRK